MKRFDDSTKKLIKNLAALITSALVLIAATVAWFATTHESTADKVNAKLQHNDAATVTYYAMPDTTNVLTSASAVEGHEAFNTDESYQSDTDKIDDSSWAEAADWSIANLYPGEYRSFKIDYMTFASINPSLIFEGVSRAGTNEVVPDSDDLDELVYDNVFMRVKVFNKTTENGSTTYSSAGAAYGSFSDFLTNSTLTVPLGVSLSAGDSIVVLIDIGMPGEGVVSEHGDLQQTLNASIAFTSVKLDTASSSGGSGGGE